MHTMLITFWICGAIILTGAVSMEVHTYKYIFMYISGKKYFHILLNNKNYKKNKNESENILKKLNFTIVFYVDLWLRYNKMFLFLNIRVGY